MEPFDAPGPSGPAPGGTRIDLGLAIRDGVGALLSNLFPNIGAAVLLFIVYLVSICSCVLWIATLPWMLITGARFVLSCVDGEGDISLLWTPIGKDPVGLWIRGWGYALMTLLVYIPSYIVATALGFLAIEATPAESAMYSVLSVLPMAVWAALIARYPLSWWYIADRDEGVIASITRCWEESGPSWGVLAVLMAGVSLFTAPAQAANGYLSGWLQSLPLGQQMEAIGMFYLGIAGIGLYSSVVGAVAMYTQAAAYRQLHPAGASEAA